MRLRSTGCALLLMFGAACEEQPPEEDPNAGGSGGLLGGLLGGTAGGSGLLGGAAGGVSGSVGGAAGGSISCQVDCPTGSAAGGGAVGGVGGSGTVSGGVGGSVSGGIGGSGTGDGLPCDVSAILKDKCQTCHGNPLMSGPMPLITWTDLQAPSTAYPGSKIADRVRVRIHASSGQMPPAGRPQLTAQELQVLDTYLSAGAQQSNVACSSGTQGGVGGTQGGGGTAQGGLGQYIPPDSECDYIMELRAHGGDGPWDDSPFVVDQGVDHYEMFWFVPPWTEKVHTIRIDPISDNGAVLHHWLLYMDNSSGDGDGSHNQDLGLQGGNAQLLSGWAPGNKSLPLGREVGLQTISGPNQRFGIEIHYNTTAYPANTADRSGARICVTRRLRTHEAAVHWLGTQAIFNEGLNATADASGTCSVGQTSHIIAMSPHMHKRGRYMKSIVANAGGGTTTITDKPFAFDDQQIFPINSPTGEIVVGPGDVITTTCTYDGSEFFTFGPNTDDEMCYNFVIAWPVGSLTNGLPGIVGGENTCIDGVL